MQGILRGPGAAAARATRSAPLRGPGAATSDVAELEARVAASGERRLRGARVSGAGMNAVSAAAMAGR